MDDSQAKLNQAQVDQIISLWKRNWSVNLICWVMSIRRKYVQEVVQNYCNLVGSTDPEKEW